MEAIGPSKEDVTSVKTLVKYDEMKELIQRGAAT